MAIIDLHDEVRIVIPNENWEFATQSILNFVEDSRQAQCVNQHNQRFILNEKNQVIIDESDSQIVMFVGTLI